MKTSKRILSILLAVVMVVLAVPVVYGASTVKSGTFGNGFSWVYDSNHCLTVKGTGAMPDYSNGLEEPWVELYYDFLFNHTAVESLIIENGITHIGNCAFYLIPVKSVSIPNSVKSIGWQAFSGTMITEVFIPAGVTEIAEQAFNAATLTRYTVSGSNSAFSAGSDGCLYNKDKTELIDYPMGRLDSYYSIPNTVKKISVLNIFNALFLTNLFIPKSLIDIPKELFAFNCPKLESVTVDSSNSAFSSDSNGCLYNKNKSELILYPSGKRSSSFSIPSSVESVRNFAFLTATNLESINIPSSVKTIGLGCFGQCVNLKKVVLQEGLERIETSAFSACVSLTEISIPASVSYIGFDAFVGTGLKSITILNPNCNIDLLVYNTDGTVNRDKKLMHDSFADATFYGYEGSTAQAYATEFDHPFISLGSSPVPIVKPGVPNESEKDDGNQSLGQRIQNVFNRILEFIRNLIYRLTHIF